MPVDTLQENAAPEATMAEHAAVASWQRRILRAKGHWGNDVQRMQDDMDFVAGYQWKGQTKLDDDRYTANLTMRAINQKVAVLYARNPKVAARQRKRRMYRLWDEKLESLALAVMGAQAGDVESMAVVEDYQQGQDMKEMLNGIGETLEILYQWNVDRQEPEFKVQLKQLVRRTCVAGVSYARLSFQRTYDEPLSEIAESTTADQMQKRAEEIQSRIASGETDMDNEDAASLSLLVNSIRAVNPETEEKLIFDFPPVSSVIIDPACRLLKGFVGASWVAQEYNIPLSEARAFFGVDLKPADGLRMFDEIGRDSQTIENAKTFPLGETLVSDSDLAMKRVRIWEVFDKRTCHRFFIAEGWKTFLLPPEPMYPKLSRFWPIFTLTFNDVETDCDTKASIYPPSDVSLLKHPAKEWNRSRQELRAHKKANRPKYAVARGVLEQSDKEALMDVPSSGVVELKALSADTDIRKIIMPIEHTAIDPRLYDTSPLLQDIMLSVGLQEADMGPVSGGSTTATESTIAAQGRMASIVSNVDDLDEFLSDMVKAGGEILLAEASPESVLEVVGPGAIWPSSDRDMFTSEVFLQVEAASSGRPNKAMEIANFERLAPLLMQAGANPNFLVREGVKRLDDRIDLNEAFPLMPNLGRMQQQASPREGGAPVGESTPDGAKRAAPQQPLQDMPSQAPVPLAAA